MEDINYIINKYRNVSIGSTVSINDLKEAEMDGKKLTEEEKIAIFNYDKYCREEVNKDLSEEDFHTVFKTLQVMANIWSYREFLEDKFSFK